MFLKKFKFLSWNVRGLGDDEKCNVVRNVIKNSRCDVCVLQETKCNKFVLSYILRFLPSFFSFDVAYNLASNSKGGTIIIWKRTFELVSSWSTRHSVTVLLRQISTGAQFLVTNVYGPSEDALKPQFIDELRSLLSLVAVPWILAGDFNLTRWLTDRSANMGSFNLMDLFNQFITDSGVIDVPLRNRAYTWSSKRPQPVFSKLDRVFTSPEWTNSYPIILLEALEVMVSDHTPIMLTCKGIHQQQRRFQFESFWFKYQCPKLMVQQLWADNTNNLHSPILNFHHRTKLLHRALKLWQAEAFGAMEKQLQFCKDSILFFDKIEEHRHLSNQEFRMRISIRERAFHLANNIELKWKQRSRCRWIAEGDRNTRFFHSFASSRLRRNLVLEIHHQGNLCHRHERYPWSQYFGPTLCCNHTLSIQSRPFTTSVTFHIC